MEESTFPLVVVAPRMAILFGGLFLLVNVATGETRPRWSAVGGAAISGGGCVDGRLVTNAV